MSLVLLQKLGAIEALEAASGVISARGFCNYSVSDQYSGTVDIRGALAIALGATQKNMRSWDGSSELVPISDDAKYALFFELETFIESVINSDIDDWQIGKEDSDATGLLSKCATAIAIAIV